MVTVVRRLVYIQHFFFLQHTPYLNRVLCLTSHMKSYTYSYQTLQYIGIEKRKTVNVFLCVCVCVYTFTQSPLQLPCFAYRVRYGKEWKEFCAESFIFFFHCNTLGYGITRFTFICMDQKVQLCGEKKMDFIIISDL